MQLRNLIFLRDILILACTAFGGPQVHISMFLKRLVVQRRYLTEVEFMEINALCNVLPGPSSTQTITAIGYKQGGPLLASIYNCVVDCFRLRYLLKCRFKLH